jgi:hypothetical protein
MDDAGKNKYRVFEKLLILLSSYFKCVARMGACALRIQNYMPKKYVILSTWASFTIEFI